VTRLGLAASYGTDEAMVEAAVEKGVNYLWWGAIRTRKMARGIRAVARRRREDLVIVLHALSRSPAALSKLMEKSLDRLGLDSFDVLLLAGHNRRPDPRLMEHARRLQDQGRIGFLACRATAARSFRRSRGTGRSTSSMSDTTRPTAGPRRKCSSTFRKRVAPAWWPSPAIAGGA
jgi:hypothetical protein